MAKRKLTLVPPTVKAKARSANDLISAGPFKTRDELQRAVRAWAEARFREATGHEWDGPSIDDPSKGVGKIHAAIARGDWHIGKIARERRAREAVKDLGSALLRIRDLLPGDGSFSSEMGYECAIALWQLWNGWRSPVTLPALLKAYPWILNDRYKWGPEIPTAPLEVNPRASIIPMSSFFFGSERPSHRDLAALSLLAGNWPDGAADGWAGLKVSAVVQIESESFRQRKKRGRSKAIGGRKPRTH